MSCRATHPLVTIVLTFVNSVATHCFQFKHAQNLNIISNFLLLNSEFTVVNYSAVHILQIELGMGWELRRLFSDPKGSPVL